MADETTYNRAPVVVAEITQPRCAKRWGRLGCKAGLGAFDSTSDLSVNFATAGLTSDYTSNNATLAAVSGGISVTATAVDPSLLVGGTASNTFSGDDFGFIVVHGKWVSGTNKEWVLFWYTVSGVLPAGPQALVVDLYAPDYTRLNRGIIEDGQEFIAVFDMSKSTAYAADWLGEQINGLRFDFSQSDDMVVEVYSIQAAAADPGAATPKCYQTYTTCGSTATYDTNGSIAWRMARGSDNVGWTYEETDADNIKTNAIPILQSASHTSSRLNVGAARTGESPLGKRATANVTFSNALWDDHVGDFYLADRPGNSAGQPPVARGGFGHLFSARNVFTPEATLRIYEGYEEQALADMSVRLFDVEQVSGPSNGDTYTIEGRDPLDKIRGKNALYPPTSDIDLASAIDATTTTIPVTCFEAELSLDLGNTGDTRFLRVGDEVMSYTGWSGTEPDLTLTGVTRAAFGTASEHEADAAMQRCARHVNDRLYNVARYIIKDHTIIPNSYIDDTLWDSEGSTYLPTMTCNVLFPDPEPVEDLLGELSRDGMFSMWWDDRRQEIPMKAVRPPIETPTKLTDADNIISLSKSKRIDERMTRISTFFAPRNFLDDLEEVANYENRRVRIDAEIELPEVSGGKIVENVIYSRLTQSFGNAFLLSASLLQRYRLPPEYVTLELDAKDRALQIGDVVDLTTRYILDIEGTPIETRCEVIAVEEPSPGSRIKIELQSYRYVGKFAIIMNNTAPDYVDATDDEKANGAWIAENTGLMPDGTDGYLMQ